MMQRALVLDNPDAGHSVRRRLPRPVVMPVTKHPMGDRQLFLLTFAAAFMAFYGFLL